MELLFLILMLYKISFPISFQNIFTIKKSLLRDVLTGKLYEHFVFFIHTFCIFHKRMSNLYPPLIVHILFLFEWLKDKQSVRIFPSHSWSFWKNIEIYIIIIWVILTEKHMRWSTILVKQNSLATFHQTSLKAATQRYSPS